MFIDQMLFIDLLHAINFVINSHIPRNILEVLNWTEYAV